MFLLFLSRFLCETVKDFVALVGDASSSFSENNDPEALSRKCYTLQHKLCLLLNTLQIESDASNIMKRKSSTMEHLDQQHNELMTENKCSRWHSDSDLGPKTKSKSDNIIDELNYLGLQTKQKASKQKMFIPKQHLWSRANSLKKAMKEIIEHTEKGACLNWFHCVPGRLNSRNPWKSPNACAFKDFFLIFILLR